MSPVASRDLIRPSPSKPIRPRPQKVRSVYSLAWGVIWCVSIPAVVKEKLSLLKVLKLGTVVGSIIVVRLPQGNKSASFVSAASGFFRKS
jgi:hypothetical protein